MDDARHGTALLGFDRDDVTTVAFGDQRFLRDSFGNGVSQGSFELALESFLDGADPVSRFGEGRRSVVGDFAPFIDGGLDLSDQCGEIADALGDSCELLEFAAERGDLVLGVSGGAQEDGDFENVRRGQDCSAGCGEQAVVDVGRLSHVEVRLESSEGASLGSGCEPTADFVDVGAGRKVSCERLRSGGTAEVGESVDDLGEFEDGDALGVHDQLPSGLRCCRTSMRAVT